MTGPRWRHRTVGRWVVAGLVALVVAAGAPAGVAGQGTSAVDYAPPTADVWEAPQGVSAKSYVLLEGATGQVLAQHRGHQPRPVASTVKMLTALTVLAHSAPDDVVTVGREAASAPGAGTGLAAGDELTVRRLLELMIVRSGNDAALALAAGTAASVDEFVERMRAQARMLDLGRLELTTPTGLTDDNRLTALQLAHLARAFLADPRLARIARMPGVEVARAGRVASRNRLLGSYPGATGVKTGYTAASGWSLVASAERGGREVIAVVLGARSDAQRFLDGARLLDHAFGGTRVTTVASSRRVRLPGTWVEHRAGPVQVTVPGATVAPTLDLPLPDTIEQTGAEASIRLGPDVVVATLPVVRDPLDAPAVTSVGGVLMGAAYRGMRAATRLDRWPRPGGAVR